MCNRNVRPGGDQYLCQPLTCISLAVARQGGRLTPCHSTASYEQSHLILAGIANCFSMSAGRSTVSSNLPLDLGDLKNVHYEGGVPWMLIPDDDGVPHIAILTEISPPVTRNVATDVRLNLFTRYVLICFQVLEIKLELLCGPDNACHENSSDFGRCSGQYSIWMSSEFK